MGGGQSPFDADVEAALAKSFACAEDAQATLDLADESSRRTATYAEVRIRISANANAEIDGPVRAYELLTGIRANRLSATMTIDPLHEGVWWGYRRLPIFWPRTDVQLPDPLAGTVRWLRYPAEAINEAGLEDAFPDC